MKNPSHKILKRTVNIHPKHLIKPLFTTILHLIFKISNIHKQTKRQNFEMFSHKNSHPHASKQNLGLNITEKSIRKKHNNPL